MASANSTDVKSSSGSNKRRRVELVDDDTAPVFPRDLSLHEVIGRYFKPLRDTEKIGMLQQALDLDNEEINKQRVMAFDDVKQCIEYLQTFIKNNTTHMKTYRVEVTEVFHDSDGIDCGFAIQIKEYFDGAILNRSCYDFRFYNNTGEVVMNQIKSAIESKPKKAKRESDDDEE